MSRAVFSTVTLLLSLSGCNQESPRVPVHTTSSSSQVESASGGGVPVDDLEADVVLSAETHVEENALNVEEGTSSVSGRVVSRSGAAFRRPFEVRLIARGSTAGAPPVRVVFSDGSGAFRVWPPPGEYRLTIVAGKHRSKAAWVSVLPDAPPEPLRIVLDAS